MPSSVVHNDDNRWQTIFIEYFLYVYGNRQAVDGHACDLSSNEEPGISGRLWWSNRTDTIGDVDGGGDRGGNVPGVRRAADGWGAHAKGCIDCAEEH